MKVIRISRRMLGVATSILMGAGLLVAVVPAPAHSYVIVCQRLEQWYSVSGLKRNWVVTHLHGYSIGPHVTQTRSRTADWEVTLTAGVSAEVGGQASGNAILAKAAATYKITLSANGSATYKKSVTVTDTIAAQPYQRHYVAWRGNVYSSGYWQLHQCNDNGSASSVINKGAWHSFGGVVDGLDICPHTRYKSNTPEYKACVGVGF